MKIAIPVAENKLTMHFGHCESFAIIEADSSSKVVNRVDVVPPPHAPGVLPAWLAEQGVNVIIAGGMGQMAQQLFTQQGIKVVVGAPSQSPESLVDDYFAGTLKTGANACDH